VPLPVDRCASEFGEHWDSFFYCFKVIARRADMGRDAAFLTANISWDYQPHLALFNLDSASLA
jgi:hypothetical protein